MLDTCGSGSRVSILVQNDPAFHPWNEMADGGHVDHVPRTAVTRLWKVSAHCRYEGEGPFQVLGIMHGASGYTVAGRLPSDTPGYMVFLEYEGDSPDRVCKLAGFESRGPFHPLGAGVGGKVMLAEISDYVETETDFVLQPRTEEKS